MNILDQQRRLNKILLYLCVCGVALVDTMLLRHNSRGCQRQRFVLMGKSSSTAPTNETPFYNKIQWKRTKY